MIEEFMAAVANLHAAKAQLKKCQASCEYDAGYYCSDDRRRVEEAEIALKKAFADAVNAVVDARFAQHPSFTPGFTTVAIDPNERSYI